MKADFGGKLMAINDGNGVEDATQPSRKKRHSNYNYNVDDG